MADSDIQLVTGGAGPLIRTLQITTYINGEPATVQMEVAAISDPNGNLLFPPTDRQDEILAVLKDIRMQLVMANIASGFLDEVPEDLRIDAENEDLS